MAKTKISEFSTTAGNNTDINSINIAEGCAPSGINDAIRELMRQLKEFQTGGAGDSVNSGGDFSVATNKFTVASASGNTAVAGTLAVTGTTTLTGALVANGNATLGDGSGDTVTVKGTPTLEVNPTLSGGTANGVLYLNGSKVATSGSALTFDGTTLSVVDSSSPRFSVNGSSTASGYLIYKNTTSGLNRGYVGYDFANDAMPFAVGGSEAMRLTSTSLYTASGINVGIGTSSPAVKLEIGGTNPTINIGATNSASGAALSYNTSGNYFSINAVTQGVGYRNIVIANDGGNLLVGKTSSGSASTAGCEFGTYGAILTRSSGDALLVNRETDDGAAVTLRRSNVTVGTISVTTSATSYNTSSDYRLKDNQQPLTGSGAFIDALQPKTWNWKADGSRGVGFIAHEVQAVSPSSVVGEKDGEQMQAMEYGSAEFIANIIAELQSLRARVAQLESN